MDQLAKIALLLEECRRLRYEDPAEMVAIGELAFAAAERLDAGGIGEAAAADCRARAAAELANAYRIADRHEAAGRMIGAAVDWWRRGSRDLPLLAQISDYAASLLCHLRRFPDALALLDDEHRFWSAWGDRHSAGRTLLVRGIYAGYAGSPRQALEASCEALELLDLGRNPSLTLSAVSSVLWFMTEVGWFRRAEAHLAAVRHFFEADGSRLNLLRRTWLEARIDGGTGRERSAERKFRSAAAGFASAGLPFPAGLVSLDLALLLLGEGRFDEIEEIAHGLVALFRRLRISRETIAALALVVGASRRREARQVEARIRAAAALLRATPATASRGP